MVRWHLSCHLLHQSLIVCLWDRSRAQRQTQVSDGEFLYLAPKDGDYVIQCVLASIYRGDGAFGEVCA